MSERRSRDFSPKDDGEGKGGAGNTGSWQWDLDSGKVRWSEGMYTIYGLDPVGFSPSRSSFADYALAEDRQRVLSDIEKILSSRVAVNFRFRVERPDGEIRVITAIGEVTERSVDGSPRQVSGINQDVTEELQVQEALRRSEERFRSAVEHSGVIFAQTDLDLRYTWITNPNVLFDPPDVLGRRTDELISCPGTEELMGLRRRVLETGRRQRASICFSLPEGERCYDVVGDVLANGAGEVIGVTTCALDISERIRLEQEAERLQNELHRAQKMEAIGNLAGGVAHEFNNILSIILGNAELAGDELVETSAAAKSLAAIRTAALRAKEVVRRLLRLAVQLPSLRGVVRIAEVVEEALELLQSTTPSSVEISRDIRCRRETVLADASDIHHMLINLFANAVEAMADRHGRIELGLEPVDLGASALHASAGLKPGRYARLWVRDNGRGIAQEELEKLFEPYFTTKVSGERLGMGLPITYSLVQSNEGVIRLDSEVGKGTLVEIFLPLVPESALQLQEDAGAKIAGRSGARILFVDDEEEIVAMGIMMLERLGFAVAGRTRPEDAAAVFAENPESFDLVITDMTMPQMSGLQLCRRLRRSRADIPLILCTGFSPQVDRNYLEAMEINGLVMKPVSREQLAAEIRRVLEVSGRPPFSS